MTKFRVFLDMDGTLIHTYHPDRIKDRADLMDRSKPIIKGNVTIPRPGLSDFLEKLSERSCLVLFTAADIDYAESVLDSVGVIHRFEAIHTSQRETRGSMQKKFGLTRSNWTLVEDTPGDHELTQYKLRCLGTDTDERVIITRHFNPLLYPDYDHDLPRVMREIKGLVLKSMLPG